MKNKWTIVTNRSHCELIKAELQIVLNLSFICEHFHLFVKQDEKLLSTAKPQEKYQKE